MQVRLPVIIQTSIYDDEFKKKIEDAILYFDVNDYMHALKKSHCVTTIVFDNLSQYIQEFIKRNNLCKEFSIYIERIGNIEQHKEYIKNLAIAYKCNYVHNYSKCIPCINYSPTGQIGFVYIGGSYTKDKLGNISNCTVFVILEMS